jgi:hypothetical protein
LFLHELSGHIGLRVSAKSTNKIESIVTKLLRNLKRTPGAFFKHAEIASEARCAWVRKSPLTTAAGKIRSRAMRFAQFQRDRARMFIPRVSPDGV